MHPTADPMPNLVERLRQHLPPLGPPRVRALHLGAPPSPEASADNRGSFCALELADGTLGLSFDGFGSVRAGLERAAATLPGADALSLAQGLATSDPLARAGPGRGQRAQPLAHGPRRLRAP